MRQARRRYAAFKGGRITNILEQAKRNIPRKSQRKEVGEGPTRKIVAASYSRGLRGAVESKKTEEGEIHGDMSNATRAMKATMGAKRGTVKRKGG